MKKMNFEQMEVINGGQTAFTAGEVIVEEINWWMCGYCFAGAVAVTTGVLAGLGALELGSCIGCYFSARKK